MEAEVIKELEVNVEQIGPQGYSAYEVYVQNGGTLSETDWLESLKGSDVDLSGYATKEDLHTHNNKSILDSITQEDIDRWNSGGGTGGSCLLTEQTITIGETGDVPVTGIELDYTSVELEIGQGMQLACSVLPSNATNNAITWSSSDNAKVKVEEGYITALASGSATITAKSVENPSISASCLVTVPSTSEGGDTGEDTTIEVTSITLDKTNLSLKVDETATLKATILPSDATNKNVVWSSSDNSKATVSNGVVTALAEGNITITARSQSNTSITATCSVTIEAKETSGETTGEKIYFKDLTPVKEGVVLNRNGKTEFENSDARGYYQVPYSEGMQISTTMQPGWLTNYPPVIIIDNGTVTVPEYTDNGLIPSQIYKHLTTTLTGVSDTAIIYVNVAYSNSKLGEYCYYIVGGAE